MPIKNNNKIIEKIVLELYHKNYNNALDFSKELRKIFSKYSLTPAAKSSLIKTYRELIKSKKIKPKKSFETLLIKRAIRTLSGVSVITLLSKPFVCPGKCIYCPSEPDMPKSYLSNEPAAARAKMNLFDPIRQTEMRIKALENNGHLVDKLEILILGGTWSVYPSSYQEDFVRNIFYAANTYGDKKRRRPKSLEEEQIINEKARYRIIGLTLETRPDYINETELKKMRRLGCTRVQIGVQHTDNKILQLIKRGHSIEQSIQATKLLKRTGFKVDHHYMPDLPGSSPAKDLKMFKYVFGSPDLQPDQIKIYPCVVNEYAELYDLYKAGQYKPYTEKQLLDLLIKVKQIVPPWLRINRLIRDIPKESIEAGNKITNLRQYLQKQMAEQGLACQCLRCREVRGDTQDIEKAILVKREYKASDGKEIFLSFESKDNKKVYAFLRLRFNSRPKQNIFDELKGAALVRELHVYGKMVPVYQQDQDDEVGQSQHLGLGKQLMAEAEKMTKNKKLNKIAVISGIGVRDYYRKLGYQLEDTYMTKTL